MQVTFVDSIQGHQSERLREIADRLRKQRPDLGITVVEGANARAMLAQHKLNFGPAIVIDGRLEYVGIPRWRFLQERISQVAGRLSNPRTAAPPATAAPTPKPAAPPTRPAATPAKPVPVPKRDDAKAPEPDSG